MPPGPELRVYLARFGVSPGDRILDIGAGTGRMTGFLLNMVSPGGCVVAQDIASGMLLELRRLLSPRSPALVCDDACRMSLKTSFFDKILCFSAFPHFTDQSAALTEFYRILRPGGRLLILHTASSARLNAFHAGLEGAVSQDRLPAPSEMIPLLSASGLELCDAEEKDDLYWVEAQKHLSPPS